MRMFRNDYSEGAAPEVLTALVATNDEQCVGYTEGDPHCERARKLIRAACGRDDIAVEFAIGGTSANLVCVNGFLKDWEGVICTPDAHINVHETGAVGATGRSVLPTRDRDGFLSVDEAERVWRFQTGTGRHMTRPAMIYISNTTELGGVWSLERFDAICDWAKSHDLKVFVDGARMGSALTSPAAAGLTLTHLAARADAFYLGGTKNGLMFGEAVVIADPGLREAFPYLIKERGGLMAKGRLLGVQFEAAFTPDETGEAPYWRHAREANARAFRLREGLQALGFEAYGDAPSNQQFFALEPAVAQRFVDEAGCEVFEELADGRLLTRFVCSWATSDTDVDELLSFAQAL